MDAAMSMHIYGLLSEADITTEELVALIREKGESGAADELLKKGNWVPRIGRDDALCLDAFDRMRQYEVTLPDGNKGVFHIHWEGPEGGEPHAYIVDHPDYRPENGYRFLGMRRNGDSVLLTYIRQGTLDLLKEDGEPHETGVCYMSFDEDPDGYISYSSNYGFGTNVRDVRKGKLADFFEPREGEDGCSAYFKGAFAHLSESGPAFHHIIFNQVTRIDPDSGLPF